MSDYYCEYCGRRYSNVRELTGNKCPRHPEGTNKGFHSLYEGSENPAMPASTAAEPINPFTICPKIPAPGIPSGAATISRPFNS